MKKLNKISGVTLIEFPKFIRVIKWSDVEKSAIPINDTADKYLPMTISLSSIGRVDIISMVPRPFSREIKPIVIPGMKNKYIKAISFLQTYHDLYCVLSLIYHVM